MRAMNKANVKAYDFHPVGDVRSTLTDDEHRENIRRGIKHCLRGDVFQIVLSRRFIQSYEGQSNSPADIVPGPVSRSLVRSPAS